MADVRSGLSRRNRSVPSQTLFIDDNLEVLRDISSEVVDLVYLNPPANTGKTQEAIGGTKADGVLYDDTWTAEDIRGEWLAEIGARQPAALRVLESARELHSESMAGYLTFMAVRLVELRRVMKRNGSIYLHCDPHHSHWIRLLMDTVFGRENFRNEIAWQRRASYEGGRRWMWAHDTLLFYAGPGRHRWTWLQADHPPGHYGRNYRYRDNRGRYQLLTLTKRGLRRGDRGEPWRGFDPSEVRKHWSIPLKWIREFLPRDGRSAPSKCAAAAGPARRSWSGIPDIPIL